MGRKHHDHCGKHTTDQAAHNAGTKAGLDVAVPNAIAQAFFQRVKARGHKHDPFPCHLADVRLHHKLEYHNGKQAPPHQPEATAFNFAQGSCGFRRNPAT